MSEIEDILAEHAILDKESELAELRPYELNPRERPDPPPNLLEKNRKPFVQVGDTIVFTGMAKSGKSTSVEIVSASILGCTDFFTPTKQGAKLLYFDTEQSEDDCLRVSDYIHRLMGWDVNERNPRFRFFHYRCAEKMGEDGEPEPLKPYEILAQIETEIMLLRPDAVVLDGCTDLMDDINDIGESVRLVRKLLALCSKYQFALITIVHQNQGSSIEEPRGHIGKELVRKCNAVFQVKKHKQGDDYYFTVTNKESRHRPIEDWSFRRGEDGLPIPYDAPSPTEEKEQKKREVLRFTMEQVITASDRLTYSELRAKVIKVIGTSERTAERRIKEATEAGVISLSGGIYTLPEPTPEHPPQ